MFSQTIVRKNEFYNSVFLMRVSEEISKLAGIEQAATLMATKLNKDVLQDMGFSPADIVNASSNDLIIAVKTKTEAGISDAVMKIEEILYKRQTQSAEEYYPRTLNSALEMMPEANLAIISVPGEYARREAVKALENGLNVFLFSSNVPLQDEKEMKQLAHHKGLMVMGPDCGTVIIDSVVLGFGNVINRGPVGIVAASGTGIQQVSTLIDEMGSGISHALGTGGRDLSAEIGGITTKDALNYLENDIQTKVILLISKPTSPEVMQDILKLIQKSTKEIVICFLDTDITNPEVKGKSIQFALTLEEAAYQAVSLAFKKPISPPELTQELISLTNQERSRLNSDQKYIRALFSGGTLCYESLVILKKLLGPVYSNKPLEKIMTLKDIHTSHKHTCLDMGAEDFVVGRPHPMIDPSLRKQRIITEAKDPRTAVILLDVILGYCSHNDPAGELAAAVIQAKKEAEKNDRYLSVIASIIGTDRDPQNIAEQKAKLKKAGVIILPSNAQATRTAASIVNQNN